MEEDFGRSPDGAGQSAKPEPVCAVSAQGATVPNAEKREGLCEICGREHRVWAAASPLWNATVRGGCINGDEEFNFLCADCFMGLAEDRGVAALFRVTAERTANLQTVTPSGRAWNEVEFRYEE